MGQLHKRGDCCIEAPSNGFQAEDPWEEEFGGKYAVLYNLLMKVVVRRCHQLVRA